MMCRAMISAWVLLALAGWSRAEDGPFKVPFETIKSQHIVVMVKLNDKGPFRLIFDTGAPTSIINTRVAKEVGLLPKDAKPVGMFGGITQYKLKSVELGELKATEIGTVIMDHPTVSAIDKIVGPVEGIMGLTLFGKYRTTIDYQAKQFTFEPINYTPPNIVNGLTGMLGSPAIKRLVVAPAGQWGFRVSKDAKDEAAGVLVANVLPGSPAAQAGLKAGDRLLTLDGRWTDTVADCYQAASTVKPGTTAILHVVRGQKDLDLTVRVSSGI